MILAPNEFALIRDDTKGEVSTYVGPNKTSLAGSDCPVVFDPTRGRFKAVTLDNAIQAFQTAPEGSYVVLENPAVGDKTPGGTGKLSAPELRNGKKVNISGPACFALWPGQTAKALPGHNLRSNEYLLCRVYDEEAAKTNWSKAVIKTQSDATTGENEPARRPALKTATSDIPTADALTMGKLFIVRGTEVSFYIPPTGIEVVPEHVNGEDRYVREAVTLERLEYCLLRDQSGEKRYERGPAVVFPLPTETFVDAPIKSNPDKARAKKFRAQELTPTSGIHLRVITDFVDDDGMKHKEGDELFITGKEQPVFFPREEVATISYGEQDVHYGIAIPAGEARYVLNRETGVISLVKGPQIFLADPRTQVIAQRALPLSLCELLYPGNAEALEVNAARLNINEQDIMGVGGANAAFLSNSYVRSGTENEAYAAVGAVATPPAGRRGVMIKGSSHALPGDSFDRKSKFTAPRSVILNTKYDGAVQTTLWAGFAMLLISKSGSRRVVQGPGTFMLEYDESPQVITLSSGKPKTMDQPFRTVFLQTMANMVSDVIDVETRDFCRLSVKVSYRVNFEGDDTAKWFSIDNYVKFLTDHMRSKIRNAVQKLGIEEFYGNHTEILRDVVLGPSKGDGTPRTGSLFAENNMKVYDLEVLGVQMQNADVEKALVNAQREVIQTTLVLAGERRKLVYVKESEELKRQAALAQAETQFAGFTLQGEVAKRKLELDLAALGGTAQTEAQRLANERAADAARGEIIMAQQDRDSQRRETDIVFAEKEQAIKLRELTAQVDAVVSKAQAITPDMIAALQAFGDKALLERLAESMAPMAILTGGKKSVVEAFGELIRGTDIAKNITALGDKKTAPK